MNGLNISHLNEMSEENENGRFADITSYTVEEKDSDSCMVIVSDKNIVQIGKCCTVVTINVNKAVIELFENNTGENAAELVARKESICTILWSNRDKLEQKWRVEFKSELMDELPHLKSKLYKKLVFRLGEIVSDIVQEFYEKFQARLEKISPGCINTKFVVSAIDRVTAESKTESMRKQLQIKLSDIIELKVEEAQRILKTTTVYLREQYRNCKGDTTSLAEIDSTTKRLFSKVRDPGIYTLLCLDTTGVSNNPQLKENLQKLYVSILQELDNAHSEDCVTFNEFVSLIVFGENEKIHIEQPFMIDFPDEKAFEHMIDAVHGSGPLLDVSKMLSIVFQIASKHGLCFHKEGLDIQPRIVIMTNGNLQGSEILFDNVAEEKKSVIYPVTFVPIDETCNESLLMKLNGIFGGEITRDVIFVSHYVKYQQMIIDAIRMGKKNNYEILESIKEHSPDVVNNIDKVLKVANLCAEKHPQTEMEAVGQELFD